MLFCWNFMPETNCFRTISLCSRAWASAHRIACSPCRGVCRLLLFVRGEGELILLQLHGMKLPSMWNGIVPHGKWSNGCITAFVSIKVWLPAETHPMQCSWRAALLSHQASSGFTCSLGVNACTKGRNAKLGQGRSDAVLGRVMLLGIFTHCDFVPFQPFLADNLLLSLILMSRLGSLQ